MTSAPRMWQLLDRPSWIVLCMSLALLGCGPVAPAPPAPHEPLPVAASFDRSWNAVIEEFTRQNIPIKTIDRAAGLLVTDPLSVNEPDWKNADCGNDGAGTVFIPSAATYTVLVRGDSVRSTVRASARWVSTVKSVYTSSLVCSSRGTWETEIEAKVKAIAESSPRRSP